MRHLFTLIVFILLIACTSASKTSEYPITSTEKVDSNSSNLITINKKDSLSYIGHVSKFEDNNLFYTDIYFADDFNYELYDTIKALGDRIMYKDEETKRVGIPIENVWQYFNLTGLSNIRIFNKENQELTTGTISHIEYVEDMIESKYVAVFEVKNSNISGYLFCVGNSNEQLNPIEYSIHENDELKSDLISHLKFKTNHVWSINHYKISDKSIYSTVSVDTTAFIIETVGKKHTTLYQSKSNESINSLAIITKEMNRRPILLTSCAMPETDLTWTTLLVFNGTGYEASTDSRITRDQ